MNRLTKQIAASVFVLGCLAAPASFAGTTTNSPAVYNAPGANVSQKQMNQRPHPSWAFGHNANIHSTMNYTDYNYLKKGGGK